MDETFQFLIRHGYTVLFVWVLAEQLGLPLPATPLLLAAGALAGAGDMNLAMAIGLAVFASLLGDVSWYEFGRRRGGRVLTLLCRMAIEHPAPYDPWPSELRHKIAENYRELTFTFFYY